MYINPGWLLRSVEWLVANFNSYARPAYTISVHRPAAHPRRGPWLSWLAANQKF